MCNLLGAAWAGLVPTVVAIAVYFCCLDGVLILQWGYYSWFYSGKVGVDGDAAAAAADGKGSAMVGNGADGLGEEEEQPLLARRRSGSASARSVTIPGFGSGSPRLGKRRTSSSATAGSRARRRSSQVSHVLLAQILEEDIQGRPTQAWMQNLLSILGVVVVGALGWAVAWGSGVWTPTPVDSGSGSGAGAGAAPAGPLGAQILGYASAVAYLGARIPQIIKNARERSCEGMDA